MHFQITLFHERAIYSSHCGTVFLHHRRCRKHISSVFHLQNRKYFRGFHAHFCGINRGVKHKRQAINGLGEVPLSGFINRLH